VAKGDQPGVGSIANVERISSLLAVMAETSAFLVPTTPVPVSSEIRGVLRYDDEMAHANLDDTVTPGAQVRLSCLIRLNRMHNGVFECAKDS